MPTLEPSIEEQKMLNALEEKRARAVREEDKEEGEILKTLEIYKESIAKKIPPKTGIVQRLFFYLFTGAADTIIDFVFVALFWLIAPEIIGDIIDIVVAGVLMLRVTASFLPRITRTLISEKGEERRFLAATLSFLWIKQIIAITVGTAIEIIPVLEIIPTWIGTFHYIVGLEDKASDKIKAYYQKRLEKLIQEAKKNI